jgi:hypothetical protein
MGKRIFPSMVLLLAIGFILNGCKRENLCDCVKGTGKRKTETRDVCGFTKIYMEDKIDVYFTQSMDSSFDVQVEAGSHLLNLIKTEVVDGELRIKNNNKCGWMRSYKKDEIKVFVKAPHLYFLNNNSVGNFYCENILSEKLIDYSVRNSGDVYLNVICTQAVGHMHGAGDIYISGTAGEHDVHCTGQGFVNAGELTTNYTWIYYNSSGRARVKTSGLLYVMLYGSGDVYYTGANTIHSEIYGKGKLISY